jgi:uncharacterized protein YeaO (DUF488 family)
LTKERAKIDVWLKDISPSAALRKWFSHDVTKWPEFQDRYAQELLEKPDLVEQLRNMAKKSAVTLVYAAKDEAHNEAVLLQRWLGAS